MNSTVSVSVGSGVDWDLISEDRFTTDIADMLSVVPSHSSPFNDDLTASFLRQIDEGFPFDGAFSAEDCNDILASLPKNDILASLPKKEPSSIDKKIQQLFNREKKKHERAARDKILYANRTPEKIAYDKLRHANYYAKHRPEKSTYEKIRYSKDKSEKSAKDKIRYSNRSPEIIAYD